MPNARGQIRITNDIPDGNSYSDGVIEWRQISNDPSDGSWTDNTGQRLMEIRCGTDPDSNRFSLRTRIGEKDVSTTNLDDLGLTSIMEVDKNGNIFFNKPVNFNDGSVKIETKELVFTDTKLDIGVTKVVNASLDKNHTDAGKNWHIPTTITNGGVDTGKFSIKFRFDKNGLLEQSTGGNIKLDATHQRSTLNTDTGSLDRVIFECSEEHGFETGDYVELSYSDDKLYSDYNKKNNSDFLGSNVIIYRVDTEVADIDKNNKFFSLTDVKPGAGKSKYDAGATYSNLIGDPFYTVKVTGPSAADISYLPKTTFNKTGLGGGNWADTNSNLILNFSNGHELQVGDYIYIDIDKKITANNKNYKILDTTGDNIKIEGYPLSDASSTNNANNLDNVKDTISVYGTKVTAKDANNEDSGDTLDLECTLHAFNANTGTAYLRRLSVNTDRINIQTDKKIVADLAGTNTDVFTAEQITSAERGTSGWVVRKYNGAVSGDMVNITGSFPTDYDLSETNLTEIAFELYEEGGTDGEPIYWVDKLGDFLINLMTIIKHI